MPPESAAAGIPVSPPTTKTVTYLEAIAEAIRDEMERDPAVFLMGQDIAEYGGAFKLTAGLLDRFGADRVINTPIAESATIGMAVGAALLGQRPIVEMQFADFVSCGFNQLVNVAAKMYYRLERPVPLVVRLPYGGGVGAGPFHSQSVEAWFLHAPGLKVVAPSNVEDAYLLMRSAVRDPNPVLYFEHKYLYRRLKGMLPAAGETGHTAGLISAPSRVEAGARIVRLGRDVTAVAWGWMVHRATEAADLLEKEGIAVEVVDLRVLAPLDLRACVESLERTGKAAVIHEAPLTAGFGGEVAARLNEACFYHLDAPVRRIAYPDTPVPFHLALEDASLPSPGFIARELRELARA
jgi:2-oxoisovalerate dehydrogenase E1 component beta subunit